MSADVHIQYSSTAVSFFFNEKNQLLRTPPKYSELAPLFLVLRRYYVIIMYYLCTKFVPCTGKSLIGKKYTLLIQPKLSDIILLQFSSMYVYTIKYLGKLQVQFASAILVLSCSESKYETTQILKCQQQVELTRYIKNMIFFSNQPLD